MHTFGDDFNFANATKNFANLDKLIKYINSNFDGIKLTTKLILDSSK